MAVTHNANNILTINSAARRLLGVREIAYDQDFLHTVRGLPYHEVRRAIDTCFREHSTMTLPELELDQSSEGSGRYVTFTIMIMQVEQSAPELAVITELDATDLVQLKKRFEAVQREHGELVGELTAANKRFGTMNKELQDAFPHYVMVLDAENLTIQAVNPAYKQLLGGRAVLGLP